MLLKLCRCISVRQSKLKRKAEDLQLIICPLVWNFFPDKKSSSFFFFAKLWNLGFCWKEEDDGKDKQRQKNVFFSLEWKKKLRLGFNLLSLILHTLSYTPNTHTYTPMHAHTYTHSHTPMHALTHTRSSIRTHPLLHTNTLTCCIGLFDLFSASLEPDSDSKSKTSLKTLREAKMKR